MRGSVSERRVAAARKALRSRCGDEQAIAAFESIVNQRLTPAELVDRTLDCLLRELVPEWRKARAEVFAPKEVYDVGDGSLQLCGLLLECKINRRRNFRHRDYLTWVRIDGEWFTSLEEIADAVLAADNRLGLELSPSANRDPLGHPW